MRRDDLCAPLMALLCIAGCAENHPPEPTPRPAAAEVPAEAKPLAPASAPAKRAAPASGPEYFLATRPAEERRATARDLRIGILWVARDRTPLPKEDARDRVVLAYLINIADEPVRVFVPGFTGPVFTPKEGRGLPLEMRSLSKYDGTDYVTLGPGEMFGRTHVMRAESEARLSVHGYYNVFEPGFDGHSLRIVNTLFSDGQIVESKPQRRRD